MVLRVKRLQATYFTALSVAQHIICLMIKLLLWNFGFSYWRQGFYFFFQWRGSFPPPHVRHLRRLFIPSGQLKRSNFRSPFFGRRGQTPSRCSFENRRGWRGRRDSKMIAYKSPQPPESQSQSHNQPVTQVTPVMRSVDIERGVWNRRRRRNWRACRS